MDDRDPIFRIYCGSITNQARSATGFLSLHLSHPYLDHNRFPVQLSQPDPEGEYLADIGRPGLCAGICIVDWRRATALLRCAGSTVFKLFSSVKNI